MKRIYLLCLLAFVLSNLSHSQTVVYANESGDFKEGLAPILLNNKWGFIDPTGKLVIPNEFRAFVNDYGAQPAFSGGFLPVSDPESELVGFINRKGEKVINPEYYSARGFSENVAIVGRQNDYVLIDSLNNIIATDFVSVQGHISDFHCRRACVQVEFLMGYIDFGGKLVVEARYEDARDFSEGLAAVKLDSKWGYIDTLGIVKIPFQFSNEPQAFSCGRAFVQGSNGKWGIINTSGTLLAEPIFNQVFPFNGGFAVVSEMDAQWNSSFSILDTNCRAVKTFPKSSNAAETISLWSGFSEGLAVGMKGSRKGLIDSKGVAVVPFKYKDLRPMSDGLSWFVRWDEANRKDVKGYVNRSGKEVIIIEVPKF